MTTHGDTRRAGERSQVQAFGGPQPKSWGDYETSCLATYGGGHRGPELEAFQHGMQTVFNLLRAEFPPAEECWANAATYREAAACLERLIAWADGEPGWHDRAAIIDAGRAVLARLKGEP